MKQIASIRVKLKPGAHVYSACQPLIWAQDILDAYYAALGLELVITSGHDGLHSRQTAHYQDQAWDLRIWGFPTSIWKSTRAAGARLVELLNKHCPYDGAFFLVLEKDHFHLEWAWAGAQPNIKNFEQGVYFYVKAA